ncbi:MAG: SMC-Scp complex subunit ScpB [Pseudomonadota bacterium]|nr:SMC-Scp complex subunit ScpB [Pseudomonadota bacterium]
MSSLNQLAEYAATLEALVFASDKPVRDRELQHHLPDDINVADVISIVMQRYDTSGGVELCRVEDGWAFRTRPAVAERIKQHKTVERPLSRAALEVLAIIAYHQPITRAEIEEIRGISLSKGTMDILLELTWIKPRGRRRTPGRPLTWGTTPAFLDYFGLSDISDLPGMEELKTAGLLRKGQILGGLMDHNAVDDENDSYERDDANVLMNDFFEDTRLDAGYDGEDDA